MGRFLVEVYPDDERAERKSTCAAARDYRLVHAILVKGGKISPLGFVRTLKSPLRARRYSSFDTSGRARSDFHPWLLLTAIDFVIYHLVN